jgi:hypothetical protein
VLIHKAELQADREQLIKEQLVAAGTLFDPSEVLRIPPDPTYSRNLQLPELERLLVGFADEVDPSKEAVIRAALALQVSLTPEPAFGSSVPREALRFFDASPQPGEAGCDQAIAVGPNPRLLLPAGSPSSLEITPAQGIEVELLLSAQGLRPDYKDKILVGAGEARYLNAAVDEDLVGESTLILRFDGAITVCPVDAATI